MNIIGNIQNNITYNYDLSYFEEEANAGYAKTIDSDKDKTILIFKNVDDHIDGNGLVALWVMQGSGVFYYSGKPKEVNPGDIIIFDDNIEHGFTSNDICIAMNIIMKNKNIESLKEIINKSNKKINKKFDI